ncbi:MAG: hypothetical protein KDA81_01395 [Planctomycetaceae bacterium]|nr:hypothetical protein [Planctomycetaceae bacterium]
MTGSDDHDLPQTTKTADGCDGRQSAPSWIVSLCFWSILMLAAVVYGAVALAPKFAVWDQVRREYRHNARQLSDLEQDVSYLESVEAAIQTDPEFVQRLHGVTAESDGEELIPVSGDLLFGRDTVAIPQRSSDRDDPPPYQKVIDLLAERQNVRVLLLSFSAGLIVFAFTFLNDAGGNLVYSVMATIRKAAVRSVARYVKPPEFSEPTNANAEGD